MQSRRKSAPAHPAQLLPHIGYQKIWGRRKRLPSTIQLQFQPWMPEGVQQRQGSVVGVLSGSHCLSGLRAAFVQRCLITSVYGMYDPVGAQSRSSVEQWAEETRVLPTNLCNHLHHDIGCPGQNPALGLVLALKPLALELSPLQAWPRCHLQQRIILPLLLHKRDTRLEHLLESTFLCRAIASKHVLVSWLEMLCGRLHPFSHGGGAEEPVS
mmetsp:Transcript_18229/g.50357  ORF Transcript_18229/g.50357 Transcript_18229/m.50357 type:complete len:212 (+) Transcript_18229:515-1150(+)